MEIRLAKRTPKEIYKQTKSSPLYLTDAHPRSSYGILVLCNDDDSSGQGYGPADLVFRPSQRDVDIFGDLAVSLTAADIVKKWTVENVTTETEERKIRLYLSQWPAGPQLPGHDELTKRQRWHTSDRERADHASAYDL